MWVETGCLQASCIAFSLGGAGASYGKFELRRHGYWQPHADLGGLNTNHLNPKTYCASLKLFAEPIRLM